MAELQVIPARHGVATFVPAGQTIKIVNTSGTQVIDTWAFALPKPDPKQGGGDDTKQEEKKADEAKTPKKAASQKSKKNAELPSQEDAEKTTQEMLKQGGQTDDDTKGAMSQKSTWSSYVPSLGLSSSSSTTATKKKNETEQQKDSRTWASYFPSGKGFSSYIPKSASDTVSAFAKDHQRDPSKSYLEQLQDFSKTPVGAAGFSALTGSGYSSSLYAGYQAWNAKNAPNAPPMEYMSMAHSRAATLHLRPKVNDVLVSNLRAPMLTLVEDTSPGIHDTLMAACDPQRYRGLAVESWEQHGSCAENLVLALKELNERAGLKGAKGIGADVTVNSVPAPLNLFMNIPWDEEGDLAFKAPKGGAGDFVRFKAERDVVVVMSACPQDVLEINARRPTDAHFVVEEDGEETKAAVQRTQRTRPPPRKLNSQQKTPTTSTNSPVPPAAAAAAASAGSDGAGELKKTPVPQRKTAPVATQKATGTTSQAPAAAPRKKPVPPAVRPQKKAVSTTTSGTEANGTPASPVEKKKPRKLSAKPAT